MNDTFNANLKFLRKFYGTTNWHSSTSESQLAVHSLLVENEFFEDFIRDKRERICGKYNMKNEEIVRVNNLLGYYLISV